MNNSQENGGKFFNGLVLGIIIGGAIVFLLSTKKGKKLLKMLTEEGLEGVSEIEELLMDGGDEEVYEEVAEVEQKEENKVHKEEHHVPQPSTPKVTKIRRFFRGVPKRG